MKQKAVISLLWPTQFEALRQFLLMHESMTLIVPNTSLNAEMRNAVLSTGSTIVHLDELLALSEADVLDEASSLRSKFSQHLHDFPINGMVSPNDIKNRLAAIIDTRLEVDLLPSIRLLHALESAVEQFDIALFITNEDVTRDGKLATMWAKSHEIPSLHLAHSLALPDPYTVHNEIIADKLAVYGKRGMEGYLDLGYPEDRMVITGNPAWDSYAQLRHEKLGCRDYLNKKYQLISELPLVVFGTTWAANLTAHCNEEIYTDTITVFFATCEMLREKGIAFNAAIKDRPSNQSFGEQRCRTILDELGASHQNYIYSAEDTQIFATAANVLIAVDSNYLIEGMLARTPVINLMNITGMMLGPCFDAGIGVLEVEAHELAGAIHLLLTDVTARDELLRESAQHLPHYSYGDNDGAASVRVAKLMSSMAEQLPLRPRRYVWQQYLDVESAEIDAFYHTVGRQDLADLYTNSPSLILDIGCATGSNATLIKQRFPGSRAWGIEMNHAAAKSASEKLDRVLVGKFEDFDLEQEGITHGTLDAVLLADVLEHMYDPWKVMIMLRPYMSPTGQLVLSIPNVRNLFLQDDLSKGNWTYTNAGLLDITHIRFFTLKEILKFCAETGYRVLNIRHVIDNRAIEFWHQHQHITESINIDLDKLTLKAVNRDELHELCTLQFHLLIEKEP